MWCPSSPIIPAKFSGFPALRLEAGLPALARTYPIENRSGFSRRGAPFLSATATFFRSLFQSGSGLSNPRERSIYNSGLSPGDYAVTGLG